MSLQGFKRILVGEPMPDKNDPKYKERYEREVEAGRRFAEATGIGRLGRWYCQMTARHQKVVFSILFALIILFFIGNLTRLCLPSTQKASAIERQHIE